MNCRLPLLITIPHGGIRVPPEVEARIRLTEEEVAYNSDPATARIYDFGDSVEETIGMDVSRVFVDVNRSPFRTPPMYPDGVVKMVTADGNPVYNNGFLPDAGLIRRLLAEYYYPFHYRIRDVLLAGRVSLAIDCHSMHPEAPLTSKEPGQRRPLVCLSNGGDRMGMPKKPGGRGRLTCEPEIIQTLATSFENHLEGRGEVAINNPFSGGFTCKFHQKLEKIPWIQLEINRDLYESMTSGTLSIDDDKVLRLNSLISSVIQEFWENVDL